MSGFKWIVLKVTGCQYNIFKREKYENATLFIFGALKSIDVYKSSLNTSSLLAFKIV